MKKIALVVWLLIVSSALSAQPRIQVMVSPGAELLGVIHLLSDSAYTVNSTYKGDLLEAFSSFKDHPAVQKARQLPFINCDFPLRASWNFYGFPDIRLHEPQSFGAYDHYFETAEVVDYLRAAKDFYTETDFIRFFDDYAAEYAKWVASFERNLYESGMADTLHAFYRMDPPNRIVFTLGSLNCGSFAIPELGGVNPEFAGTTLIHVAYGNIVGSKAAADLEPDYFSPSWANQLVWHEMGHAYVAGLFEEHAERIEALRPLFEADSTMKAQAGLMGWSMYLNENTVQAVTSYLRIKTGVKTREEELARVTAGPFYVFVPLFIEWIETDYVGRYEDFAAFFPVMLERLDKEWGGGLRR